MYSKATKGKPFSESDFWSLIKANNNTFKTFRYILNNYRVENDTHFALYQQ